MEFEKSLDIVKEQLNVIGITLENPNKYDGFIVKELKKSNTLDEGRSTNQTHIAITGEQMSLFPMIYSGGYEKENGEKNSLFKKYFTLQIRVKLNKENLLYLGSKEKDQLDDAYTCVIRSKREKQSSQLQLSMQQYDSKSFWNFRKLCHADDYLIILKRKNKIEYEFYGIKSKDVKPELKELNNKIYIDKSTTVIKGDQIMTDTIGYNKIYYGIPGCGKSYHIEHNVLGNVDHNKNVFRTTFYLDYSNSDFIGQIYPKVTDGKVTYEPVPGPFTKALERALSTDEMVYLVIEEINRGNAAAIFGDTFQLLDRLKQDNGNRVAGDSEYPISNGFIEDYFDSVNKNRSDDEKIKYEKNNIYIPHNLTLLATMNTSDQNVYPLDTAFKRRWNKEKIESNWGSSNKLKDLFIPYTNITWETFASIINEQMIERSQATDTPIAEDKQMGAFFANESMLSDKPNDSNPKKMNAFTNNVLDYLYNDVTKFDHTILFKPEVNSTSKLFAACNPQVVGNSGSSDPNVNAPAVGQTESVFSTIFIDEINGLLNKSGKKAGSDNKNE